MKSFAFSFAFTLCLFFPALGSAQNNARIECARSDGYVYLYSSQTTLDIRGTLQCGELVQITGRDGAYYVVRTAKGDIGFVPDSNIALLKIQPGTSLPQPATASARERIHYDETPAPAPAHSSAAAGFALPNGAPVRLKILKSISSATAHAGDPLEFEVLQDVQIDGLTVISKGAKASGGVADAQPKKHFGHGGRLAFKIDTVRLTDNESAPLRCFQDVSGSSNTSSDSVVALSSGKDAAIPAGTEFTALVDGTLPLRRESFTASKDTSPSSPTTSAIAPQSHP